MGRERRVRTDLRKALGERGCERESITALTLMVVLRLLST